MIAIHGDTPEQVMAIASDTAPGYPVDAIDCALARADSVLCLLEGQFDGSDSEQLADHLVANILWSVRGQLALIKAMVKHGHDTSKEAGQ